jgi:hypothetical protein
MTDTLRPEDEYLCAGDIFECRTIAEIKAAATAFLDVAEGLSGVDNGIYLWGLCEQLRQRFDEWLKLYRNAEKGAAWNAVIVPSEHAPIMLLAASVPIGGAPVDVMAGLKNFIKRCDEFTPPVHTAIELAEIKRVLTAAQKTYRLLDILAPTDPLKILRFDNSHKVHNSECGIPDNGAGNATILLYHPHRDGLYDRVFIFAHELGHALHLALTCDIDVLPDGFDEFNKSVGQKPDTLKDEQEAFADAVALAILNVKGLGTHFPNQFAKAGSPSFALYVRELCTRALERSGSLDEPLPPSNLMRMRKMLTRPPR